MCIVTNVQERSGRTAIHRSASPLCFSIDPKQCDIHDYKQIAAVASQCNHEATASPLHIDGLHLLANFVDEEVETDIVTRIDRTPWMPSQSGRRKQDYGPKVSTSLAKRIVNVFAAKRSTSRSRRSSAKHSSVCLTMRVICCMIWRQKPTICTTTLHSKCAIWSMRTSEVLVSSGTVTTSGSGAKGDGWDMSESCRVSPIRRLISINLLGGAVMSYCSVDENDDRLVLVWMPRRSLLCMRLAARYEWLHGILPFHYTGKN